MAGKFYNLLKEIYIIRTIKRSGLFDREYYLKNNLDVARSCMNPIRHYVRYGWKEERNPNQNFDTKWYLTNYPDVAASGMNPFYHYCKFGIKEGRNSSGHIDSKINPLVSNPESGQYQNNRVCSRNYHESEGKLLCKVREYNEQKLKRKANVVVYTAITGNYDSLIIPEYINKDWDYVCFSDDDIPVENLYEIRRLDSPVDGYRRSVRYVKTQPHLFFPNYEYSIWIDANIMVRGNHLENAVKDGMERNVLFMGCRHPFKRDGIYDELAACILARKDNPKVMIEQVTRYINEGFPGKSNFLAGGLIIRKHNDHKIASFGEHWWSEIAKGSFRDQLSLMYVIWKLGLDYEEIPNLENIYDHSDYCVIPHTIKLSSGDKRTCCNNNSKHTYHLPKTVKINEYQIKINYFDMGLCDGEELEWMVESILPSLGIENYRAYGFEPYQAFYDNLKSRFCYNSRIILVKKAISNKNGTTKLYCSWESKEGHSIFDTKNNVSRDKYETVETVLFSDWLRENVPDFSDSFNILRFNIEGAEWYLINDLVKNDLVKNIDIFCGHGDDMKKISEFKDKIGEYYEILRKYNIKILSFCSIHPETQEHVRKMIQSKLTLKNR